VRRDLRFSVDILSRPFWLPETVDTGDWIEIGHIGAYSLSLQDTVQRVLSRRRSSR
jgi:diaminopimelate decarboxylase